MRVLMTVSLVEMPSFTLREEGTTHQVDDATGAAWVASGLAKAVPVASELAAVRPGAQQAVMPKGRTKRG